MTQKTFTNEKKIKRKKGITPQSKNYFNAETDNSIRRWQLASPEEKKKIYTEEISPAFNLLVSNLMWVYNFKTPKDFSDDVKQDCISFLYENLNKWNKDFGSKAFSYFNITAKRWLINRSRKALKENVKFVSVDCKDSLTQEEHRQIEMKSIVECPDEKISQYDITNIVDKLFDEIELNIRNDNEKIVLLGLKSMFENIDSLDIINKRSVLLYLRDITGLNQKELSNALSFLRKNYKGITGNRGIFSYEFWED
jgi:hypothetical protein